eukprot:GFYU01005827.1.p1 GENE.GFYU01005827.1~~GFYU01005827.1.p1  ORF type:complete len:350 (-),score=59.79 GFYU01005827.1:114-1163(-)
MADRLARIFGTEEDKVNCPFYFKIGACRHGDRCSRMHNRPSCSQTLLISHMYQNPRQQYAMQYQDGYNGPKPDEREVAEHFDDFYSEVFEELAKYGEIDELNVCDNIGDHMVGNVYVKYFDEESAARAKEALTGRFYSGKPIMGEFSPVTDFREARCRQFDEASCNRGGLCNFMHLRWPDRSLRRKLFDSQKGSHRRRRSRSRSRSPPRRGGDRDRRGGHRDYGGGYGGRGREYRDYRGDYRGDYHRGGGDYRDDRGRDRDYRRDFRDDRRDRDDSRDGRRGGDGHHGHGGPVRDRRRSPSPVRESSAERRARIAAWENEESEPNGGGPVESHPGKPDDRERSRSPNVD